MIQTGLVSITFRKLSTDEIIELVKKTGLTAIEWGGDIHVPHGEIATAKSVYSSCIKNGIECPSYGSYYRIGEYDDSKKEFMKVIQCAKELHSETIRVWAGTKGSKEASDAYYEKITNETKQICSMAQKYDISVSFEYHRNTLTDSIESTLQLINDVDHKNLYTYWQPEVGMTYEDNLSVIKKIRSMTTNIHVFSWDFETRLPLSNGKKYWIDYFKAFQNGQHYAMIEFVKNDDPNQFLDDAAVLLEILNEC